MSEECFGGVLASAKVSVCRLSPFCGDEGQEKAMFVCRAKDLNQHLSSIPLTTIRKTKYGKMARSKNTAIAGAVACLGLMSNTRQMVSLAMSTNFPSLKTTLMLRKIL